ncbi:hypothetical protein CXG46_19085 [Nocardioides alpinus]|uniref:Uncharacterized protein n=1 Tax=Nocardioides alpinus TaxID=748909 RepID=A0ABX4QSB2_9ACTN|nr:hypothetical protein CXG46_19085 [Nocardioides alpinus]
METAWREFRQRLADHVAAMDADDSIVVEMPQVHNQGASPYCQVAGGEEMLRVEAVSNAYLADECSLDVLQEGFLAHLGFRRPETEDWSEGETNFWADLELREADRAAVMVVHALREVYGVLHPVYLDAGGLEPEGAVRPVPPQPGTTQADLDDLFVSSSVKDIRSLVDLAVADIYDDAPMWDDDGDLGLLTEEHVVWVAVNAHAPRVLLSCMLLDEVDNTDAALAEINRLNRAEWGLTFTLHERRISVTRELGLGVAQPVAVQGEIQRVLGQVDVWARDLGERLRAASEDPAKRRPHSRFATAYAVMAELEREQRGSVSPAAMVRIYRNDTGLLLKAIRITEQRRRDARTKAREAHDLGQRAKEQMIRARLDYLRDLVARMRAGLRMMVDAPVRRAQVDQLALFDEDEAGAGR